MVFKNNPGCGCCDDCGGCAAAPPATLTVVIPALTNSSCGSCADAAGSYVVSYNAAISDDLNCYWTGGYSVSSCGDVSQITVWFNSLGIIQVEVQLDDGDFSVATFNTTVFSNSTATPNPSAPVDCSLTYTLELVSDLSWIDSVPLTQCTLATGGQITITPPA